MTYRSNTFLGWFGRVMVLFEIVVGTVLLATAHDANGTQGWIYAVGALFLVFGLGLLVPILVLWRATSIGGRDLRIPSGLRTWKVVPLSGITGVGLLFSPTERGSRAPAAWTAFVWADALGRIPLRSLTYAPLRARSSPGHTAQGRGALKTNPWELDPFALTDVAHMEHSTAGEAASDIYRRVASFQGPLGLLLTQHQEKHGTYSVWDLPMLTAFWSPDGEYGRLERRDPPQGTWDDDE
jgi:hypothetical protein